jgi:hypothetical protein
LRIKIFPRPFHAWVTVNGIAVASNAIVADLNKIERRASTRKRICNWACGISVVTAVFFHGLPLLALLAFAIARTIPARRVAVNYEIDGLFSAWYGYLLEVWPQLAATGGRWLLQHRTPIYSTHEWKVNAGADGLVARLPASFQLKPPKPLKTNLSKPTVSAGSNRLVFLPDQVLVRAGKYWSGLQYSDLEISYSQSRHIENSPPFDGTVVGETWRYTNVNGTPDRRFNNNLLLPIILYSEIRLNSSTGFDWAMQISQQGPTAHWVSILANHPCFKSGNLTCKESRLQDGRLTAALVSS